MAINVLIVEDDPMVAEFNRRFLQMVEGYELLGMASSAEEAEEWMEKKEKEIQLILLDVYMPGINGLEFLSRIRGKAMQIDVILITAADDTENIQTALHHGAIDYLIKPFEFERFKQALLQYKEKYELMHGRENLNQQELDQKFLMAKKENSIAQKGLAKGLTKSTLTSIMEKIQKEHTFTTDKIAHATGISRVSVRKYLMFLVEIDVLEETLTYGIGRPVSHYTYRGNREKVDAYLQ